METKTNRPNGYLIHLAQKLGKRNAMRTGPKTFLEINECAEKALTTVGLEHTSDHLASVGVEILKIIRID